HTYSLSLHDALPIYDRDTQLAGFLNRDLFLVGVDHKDEIRQAAHILDTANGALKLVALAGQVQDFLLGQTTRFTGKQIIEFAQTADRVRDRLPVGQHAAKPTMVDVVLRALLCRLSDRLGGLTLRADKKHAATGSNHVTHCDERLMKQRNGLR